jgi:hypothetical protein
MPPGSRASQPVRRRRTAMRVRARGSAVMYGLESAVGVDSYTSHG